jgi:hypothetical protein
MLPWQDRLAAECSDAELAAFIDQLEIAVKRRDMPDYVSDTLSDKDLLRDLEAEDFYGQPMIKALAERLADRSTAATNLNALVGALEARIERLLGG